MTAIVPSYIAKVSRAKKHLVELEEAIERYSNTKPYTVRQGVEGKKKTKVWRLVFTSNPADTDIPIIAADVIYNLRSSLDHLMSALVAKKDRNSAIFPIFFQGVWEAAKPGEDPQRLKVRERWTSDTATMRPEAVAFLKKAQPLDDGGQDIEEANLLRVLNRWSNRDRHEKLPVVAAGLSALMVKITRSDGRVQPGFGRHKGERPFFKDQTRLAQVPDDAVQVKIAGVPAIAMGVGGAERYLEIPEHLHLTAKLIEHTIIPGLIPYIQA
jgi:hypothetical protein